MGCPILSRVFIRLRWASNRRGISTKRNFEEGYPIQGCLWLEWGFVLMLDFNMFCVAQRFSAANNGFSRGLNPLVPLLPEPCSAPHAPATLLPGEIHQPKGFLRSPRAHIGMITGLAFLLFLAGAIAYTAILYNGLIRLRNENDRALANIDVLLKQRHDEIPNLVETVKGYMQHEQQTLVALTQARAASMNAASINQKAVADLKLENALRGFFAVAENYPQLKANENFLKLQTRISELEDHIADRREFFNDDVNTYNTRIAQIPDVFLASFMNLKPRSMFQVSEEDRKQVEVSFTRAANA
jgi:LemA protein